jgi:hypothetical protein
MSQATLQRLEPAIEQLSVLEFFKQLQWDVAVKPPVLPPVEPPVQTFTQAPTQAPIPMNAQTVGAFFAAIDWATRSSHPNTNHTAPNLPQANASQTGASSAPIVKPEPSSVDLNAIADLLSFDAARANDAAVSSLQGDDCSLADFSDFF